MVGIMSIVVDDSACNIVEIILQGWLLRYMRGDDRLLKRFKQFDKRTVGRVQLLVSSFCLSENVLPSRS